MTYPLDAPNTRLGQSSLSWAHLSRCRVLCSADWANWGWFLVFLSLTIILQLPSVSVPFDNDGGAIAYHARLITRGEPLYGSHHTGHHLPGAYYIFAAAFTALGDRVESVKILLIGWVSVTAYLIYRLGTALSSRPVGAAAGVCSVVLLSSIFFSGTAVKIEAFVGLSQTASVLALVYALRQRGRPSVFFWVGLFSGLTILLKPNYVAPTVLAGVAVLGHWLRDQPEESGFNLVFRRFAWGIAGGVAAFLPVMTYFHTQGLLGRMWNVVDTGWGYTRTAISPEFDGTLDFALYPLAVLGWNNPVLLAMAIVALYVLVRASKEHGSNDKPAGMLLAAGWFGLGFFETGVTRTFFPYYYLVLVPSLSLLAGWLLARIAATKKLAIGGWRRSLLLFSLIGPAIGWSLATHWDYYTQYYVGHILRGGAYEEFMLLGLPDGWGESVLALQEMAEYIQTHTEEREEIYYWSNLVQLYYLSDRLAPTDILWPLYVDATGSHDRVFSATYVIVGEPVFGYDSVPRWLADRLEADYQIDTILHGQQFFRRKARASAFTSNIE